MGVHSVNRVCPEHTCQFGASGYYSDDMMYVGYKRSGEQPLSFVYIQGIFVYIQ